MMVRPVLPLVDPHLRLTFLAHLAQRLARGEAVALSAAGFLDRHLQDLRVLSALDLSRLAGVRALGIEVCVDGNGLEEGLRLLALMRDARALEEYFIRNGASARMMHLLFSMRQKSTLAKRRELGGFLPRGGVQLPDSGVREHIVSEWRLLRDPDPRTTYLRLHRVFPELTIAALEAVIRNWEAGQ